MFLKFVIIVCQFLLLIVSNCNLVNGFNITASTNVSTVQVGQPFTLKCEVTDLVLGNELFEIRFYYKILKTFFARYEIPGKTTLNFISIH